MLTVGTDSYVTVAEADVYIGRNYRSTSSDRSRWEGLSEEDKEILLRQACGEIERLPLRGRKFTSGQPFQFPRVRYSESLPPPDCPNEVRAAQIELALWLSDEEKQTERKQRQSLQTQGVTAVSIGSTSESYVKHGGTSAARQCLAVISLLSGWLNGGCGIV